MEIGTKVRYKNNPRLKDLTFIITKSYGKLVYLKPDKMSGRTRAVFTNELEKIKE